jgi:hypothetical protein
MKLHSQTFRGQHCDHVKAMLSRVIKHNYALQYNIITHRPHWLQNGIIADELDRPWWPGRTIAESDDEIANSQATKPTRRLILNVFIWQAKNIALCVQRAGGMYWRSF